MRLDVYQTAWVRVAYDWRLVLAHGGTETDWRCIDLVTGDEVRVPAEGEHIRRATRQDIADVGLDPNEVPDARGAQVYDPYWDRRRRSSWFRSVVAVLEAFPEVVYHHVDWRPWLYEPDCEAERRLHRAGHPVRSDGYGISRWERRVEGFASTCYPRPGEPLSDTVFRRLAEGYEIETAMGAREWHPRGDPKLSFEELLVECFWTEEVFDALDATHEHDERQLATLLDAYGLQPQPIQPLLLAA